MLFLLYGGSIIVGILFGVLMPSGNKRFAVRLITGVLALPVVAVAALLILLRLTIFREPPTLAELQADIPRRRIDLTTLVEMATQD
jgi:hypothetical protein